MASGLVTVGWGLGAGTGQDREGASPIVCLSLPEAQVLLVETKPRACKDTRDSRREEDERRGTSGGTRGGRCDMETMKAR